MNNILRPTERIIMQGGANKTVVAGMNIGGKLTMTNERLIFKHTLGGSIEQINLSDISYSGDDFNLFIPSNNMIHVTTKTGEKYQFLVSKKDKDAWAMNLGQIHNIMAGNNIAYDTPQTEQVSYSVPASAPVSNYNYTQPKKKKNWIKICIIVAAVFCVLLVFAAIGRNRKTVKCEDVQSGALLNMDLERYNEEFSEASIEGIKELTGEEDIMLDVSDYWNNLVEPQKYTEEDTNAKMTLHSAFIEGTYLLTASVYDDKINSISVCFDYADDTIPVTVFAVSIMAVGHMDINEACDIADEITEGIDKNTMVYKDGILYAVETSTVSYYIIAATEEFVKDLEDSGSCNVIYMD